MSSNGRKPPKYPFGAIKAHQNVQSRIESDLAKSIRAPSE